MLAGCKNKELEALNNMEKDRFIVKSEKAEVRDLEEEILLVGSVKALDEATLYPRVSGKLLRNVLREGDHVQRNQTVALIERDEVGVVYEPAPVPSTITGVVGRTYLDTGANVTPTTPIAMVVNQSEVRIQVDVPERYLGKIGLGGLAIAEVEAFPGKRFTGRINKISPVIDLQSRATPIEVLVNNPGGALKSGMFAKIHLITGKRKGVSVSAKSISEEEDGKSYLFIVKGEKVEKRAVIPGIKTIDYVEINSGLKTGEEVVNFGIFGLNDGSKIEVQK